MSGLGLLTLVRFCLPRLEVLGLLLQELRKPALLTASLLVLPDPLLELEELARSLLDDFDLDNMAELGGAICGGERLLGGELPT